MKNIEDISAEVVDTALHLHKNLGPGLLESVYEVVLAKMLENCKNNLSYFKPENRSLAR